jgi:adenosylcobinamide kinase / adenosylcobinamide-phosphate guanylyltransferase
MRITLITGPARSGKSEWAEGLAKDSGKKVVYVATSDVDKGDLDWQKRLELHRARRPDDWTLLEIPVAIATTIRQAQPDQYLLIDSLGTWVANSLAWEQAQWQSHQADLLDALRCSRAEVALVAEETGWGVVPAYPIGGLFRDRLGMLVRWVGAMANPVYLVSGGHVLNLSQLGQPLPPP